MSGVLMSGVPMPLPRFPVHASGRAMSVDDIWIARKAEEGWRNKQRLATWRAKLKLYGWEYV